MIRVIDACVAIKWYVEEPDNEQAMCILDRNDVLIAPDFILLELASVGAKKVRRGEMSTKQLAEMLVDVPLSVKRLEQATSYIAGALTVASEIGHPVYDCLYVAMAEAYGVKFVTADQKLIKKLEGSAYSSIAISLSDFTAEAGDDIPDDISWLADESFSDLQRLIVQINNIGTGLPEFLKSGNIQNIFISGEFVWNSPAGIALKRLVDGLDSSSKVTLIAAALMPIVENFSVAVEQAQTIVSDPEIDLSKMLVQYLPRLSKGLEYLKSRRGTEPGTVHRSFDDHG